MVYLTVASQVKETLNGLKGIEANLRTYSIKSQSRESKAVFSEALKLTSQIVLDVEKRVKTLESQEPQYKGK